MKISKYLGTFALLAMLAACSTEDEQVRFAGDEVKVNATIGGESVFTRSNPIGSTEEQSEFQDFDQIGISVNGGAAHKYEMKNGVWGVAESEVPIKWESEATDFKAFYPYSYNNVSNSFDNGQICTEQNIKEGLALSDYMTAKKTYPNIPENRQLDLIFKRQTARVIIDIENSTFTNEFPNPVVAGINIYSQLELPATQGVDVSVIKAYKMDASNPKSSWVALVAPNAEDASKNFICISVQENSTGTAKAYSIKGIPNLERGKSYTYKLKIGKDRAIIDNVTVTDWKEGAVIPGGEASVVTVESIKESVTKQLENGNKVELTLPSNASSDIFAAIKDAIKDKGVSEGQVDLTLKGVMTIPEKAFDNSNGGAPWFNEVILPDVTIIKASAFEGSNLRTINAPNVEEIEFKAFHKCIQLEDVSMRKASKIGLIAFSECRLLRSVWFGALSSVMSLSEHDLGGIFDKVTTTKIELTLSTRQAKLGLIPTYDANYEWYSTGQSYWDSEDYSKNKILGYTFARIIRADD
ncbi:fimbrillin family protein [Segatella copri]|uniref:fimbrillin family protein n=1 Tax=Segatella copri TaxID=165179 RepID=UPI00293B6DF8|nr:fimbrillin family protein [Segatella copri]MDV3105781.1 fimbrillin family protein [Segatella copri]WOF88502.1 fimbrillin family protein [Segatella copri]WOF93674.1 fimbrillin family protein [Segatella copri]